MKNWEEFKERMDKAYKTGVGIDEIIAELKAECEAYIAEHGHDDDAEDIESIEEEEEDIDEQDTDNGYVYDQFNDEWHYEGHKTWEQRAFEDSGMTWHDFA